MLACPLCYNRAGLALGKTRANGLQRKSTPSSPQSQNGRDNVKSVKVDKLMADLGDGIDSVVTLVSQETAKALADNPNEVFSLFGLVVGAYYETELSEDQALELSKAETALEKLAEKQAIEEGKIRVKFFTTAQKALEKAKAQDHASILLDNETKQAKALAALADQLDGQRLELQNQVRELSTVKVGAAMDAIKTRYRYDGKSGKKTVRPDIPGNNWLILDLFTRTEGITPLRGQFYLDQDCTLWFYPVGQDWYKPLARPFELEVDTWNEVLTFPADNLPSASFVQAVAHDAIKSMRQHKSKEALASYLAGIVKNGNVDQSSTGGSRSVWHVVTEKQEPGFARQLTPDKTVQYNLPSAKPSES